MSPPRGIDEDPSHNEWVLYHGATSHTIAFSRSCHLVEVVSWCRDGSVNRRGHHLVTVNGNLTTSHTIAFSRSCHLVEVVSCCGDGSVDRRGHHLVTVSGNLRAQCYINDILCQDCSTISPTADMWCHSSA